MEKNINKFVKERNRDVTIKLLNSFVNVFNIPYQELPKLYVVQMDEKDYVLPSAHLDAPELIVYLLDEGFTVTVRQTEYAKDIEYKDRVCYSIDGFAKAGSLFIVEDGNKLIALGRYTEPTEIESFYDILLICRECHRYNPDYGISGLWYDYFLMQGWIGSRSPEPEISNEFVK